MEARIAMMFGGRVAEELIYGTEGVTAGAADDIRHVTALARRMVTELGFSDALGAVRYCENDGDVLLGRSLTPHRSISQATAAAIDQEIDRIIRQAHTTIRRVLSMHFDELHRLANGLIERETLSGEETRTLLCADSSGESEKVGSCDLL